MKTIKTIVIIIAILILILPDGMSDIIWNGVQYLFAIIALMIYLPTRGKRR